LCHSCATSTAITPLEGRAAACAAAVAKLARAVVIIMIAVVGLASIGGVAGMVLRLQHGQARLLAPRVYGSTSVHAAQGRPEPRALPARQEVHLHFHGVSAEEVAAIVAGVRRDR
jgi:hypothetical protein